MEGFYHSPTFYHRFNPLPSLVIDRFQHFNPHLSYYDEPLELTSPPPLDLSLKSSVIKSEPPVTPPSTPSPKSPPKKQHHTTELPILSPRTPITTPVSNSVDSLKKSTPGSKTPSKRHKAVRKLNFDEDKVSPVSGTIIRSLDETFDDKSLVVRKGDIDPIFNVVEVTEEAKAEIAKIENKIGDYVCRLCRITFDDAFSLAQHRCSCIVHVEYRCPECDKVFNCPANLASHRRWHKPKDATIVASTQPQPRNSNPVAPINMHSGGSDTGGDSESEEARFPCPICGKLFRRQSYLRKHLVSHSMTSLTSPTTQHQPMTQHQPITALNRISHLAVAN